jgi:hypothetical protein
MLDISMSSYCLCIQAFGILILKCCILSMLTNKNEGVAVTQTNDFTYQFTTYFGFWKSFMD